jgi:hypothetical protein
VATPFSFTLPEALTNILIVCARSSSFGQSFNISGC